MEGTSKETVTARPGRGLCVPANDETQTSLLPQMLEPEPNSGGGLPARTPTDGSEPPPKPADQDPRSQLQTGTRHGGRDRVAGNAHQGHHRGLRSSSNDHVAYQLVVASTCQPLVLTLAEGRTAPR